MKTTSDYIQQGKKCLQFAQKEGADQAEIYITNARSISAQIEKGSMKYAKNSYDHGISIRCCVKNGAIGFSFSTDFNWKALEKMISTAIKLSKAGIPDPDFKNFPYHTSYPNVAGTFDKEISSIDVSTAMDYSLRTATAAKINTKISSINVDFHCGTFEQFILNTNDIQASSKGTAIQVSAEIVGKENSDTSSGYEFQASRFLKEIDPEFIGKSSAEMALKNLHAKNIETGTYSLILHPFAVATLLSSAIGYAINGELIQYKSSYLTNMKNEKIAVDLFNVVDNGLFINKNGIAGLGTAKFDTEGVPRQKTTIILDGILKNYLYDTYTAGKEGRQSTGNASRSSYRSVPSISISNLQISGKSGNLNSFISEINNGILIINTGDRPNIATGDFSGLISMGFKIENGAIAYPLKKAMLGINMLDFFKQIYAVGNDHREVHNIITPSLCVSKVKIAGAN